MQEVVVGMNLHTLDMLVSECSLLLFVATSLHLHLSLQC
jgi:hypothetical protein